MKATLLLALMAVVVFLLAIQTVWAFTPYETPAAVAASAVSSTTTFTLTNAINAPDVKVCNNGAQLVYWVCGNSSVVATVPGAGSTSTTIGAGLCGKYYKGPGSTTCAAITSTSTSSVTFTAGGRQ